MALFLFSCGKEREYVFIPAPNYSLQLEITVPATANVNEWIPLKASRRSGPWIKVKRAEQSSEVHYFVKPPPSFEAEVANNLSWLTEPPRSGHYDLPTLESVQKSNERKVMFSKPGVYRIWAVTAIPTRGKSNIATITVNPSMAD